MGFLSDLVSAPGWLIGPPTLLAGLVAIGACGWATLRFRRKAARRAVWCSLIPVMIGALGAGFGALRWTLFYGPAVVPLSSVFPDLGYTVLFGALVTVLPLVWAVTLLQRLPPTRPGGPMAADYDDRTLPARNPSEPAG
jgi:hypothetical protein